MPTDIPATTPAVRRPGFRATLHALCLYVAAGIASFGWAFCELLGWRSAPWLPLWFSAALLVYIADRLRPDAADPLNLPRRDATFARLRLPGVALLSASAITLVALPILRRDWLTLGLVIAGAFVCLSYSWPFLGFRIKSAPLLKTLFAPTIVALAVIALPLLHGARADAPLLAIASLHAWGLLLFNMILCDLRDLDGDRRTGIRSLPVVLGEKTTRRLLGALLVGLPLLAFAGANLSAPHAAPVWRALAGGETVFLAAMLAATRRPRSEAFYEWWVEGILFLPALAVLACAAVSGGL